MNSPSNSTTSSFGRWVFLSLALYVVSLGTSMAGMEIFSALLVFTTLVGCFFFKPPGFRWSWPPFSTPLILLSVVMLAGILLGDSSLSDKVHDIRRIRFFLFYGVFWYALVWFAPEYRKMILLIGAVGLVIGLYGAVQHFVPLDLVRPAGKKAIQFAIESERLGPLTNGTFNHHLTFSNVYLFYALLLLGVGLYVKSFRWAVPIGILLFVDCFWTQSRSAWAAIPISLFALVLPLGRRIVLGVLVLLFIVFALAYSFDPGFRGRLTRAFGTGETSFGERSKLWAVEKDIFLSSPIWGVGWNNNERHCSEFYRRRFPSDQNIFCGHAHSAFFQILTTTGIVGFVLYLWVWIEVFLLTWRSYVQLPAGSLARGIALSLLCGWIGFQVQGITQWNFGDAEVLHNVIFFWAVAAALATTPGRSALLPSEIAG